ncbi:hypothetical protein B0O80DRAFT_502497 [Mortierella sp. GBAus27b]|nr:hypothetical protein BGX31_009936 [Mortierella sp. GBA43]KAI8347686.1 hypothetical protein B0O80DRAFT_502497 [Mortierella sp. GBAus27b]
MASWSNNFPTQAIRDCSSGEIIYVPTTIDHETGQCVVLWKDIQDTFENAKSVRSGKKPVPFMKDECTQNIMPLRIAHNPEIVLEVVVQPNGQAISDGSQASTNRINTWILNQEVEDTSAKDVAGLLDVQIQSLDQLTRIKERVRDLLLHDFEIHDSPIPRLFIILPKAIGPHCILRRPESEQFRLHFLCECGVHTMPIGSSMPHEVHLTAYEGYDIVKPMELIEEYGTYLLAMMYMVKYGASTGTLEVPALANLKGVKGIIDGDTEHFTSTVDDMIEYLHEARRNARFGIKRTADLGDLGALKRLDLKRLQSYLKVNDHGQTLGNMFRMVTRKGHIKWVCSEHYRDIHQDPSIEKLRDFLEMNCGTIIDELGTIDIKIRSRDTAKEFYKMLASTRRIMELDIALEWNATMQDFQLLAKAVTNANLIALTLDGSFFKLPLLDVINSGKRYNPIARLGFNSRLQSLGLKNFRNFFTQIGKAPSTSPSTLRMLVLDIKYEYGDESIVGFAKLLGHCPSLEAIKIKIHHRMDGGMRKAIEKLSKLKSLEIDYGLTYTARVSKGKPWDMVMHINRLSLHASVERELFRRGSLTQLRIDSHGDTEDTDELIDILYHNPQLYSLQIGSYIGWCQSIINSVIATRAALLQDRGYCELRTLEVMDVNLSPFAVSGGRNRIHSLISFDPDSTAFEMATWITMMDLQRGLESVYVQKFFKEYGWSVSILKANLVFNQELAATFDDAIGRGGSQLEKLDICPLGLSDAGLDHLCNIVLESPCLTSLSLSLSQMESTDRIEKIRDLLHRLGDWVSGLIIEGQSPYHWLSQLAESFPTRHHFPNLETLSVKCLGDHKVDFPSNCGAWITAMIANRPQQPEQFASSSLDTVIGQPTYTGLSASVVSKPLWTPITVLIMEGFMLEFIEWTMIIEAMDFCTLQRLSFYESNVEEEHLKLLVDRITGAAIEPISLRCLDIRETNVTAQTGYGGLRVVLARLQKIPLQILCNPFWV